MAELVLTTFDWVPQTPRGYVRDLRVRWALEEAGLPYRVESLPSRSSRAARSCFIWASAVTR
jgi:glutathione S-transferase